MAKRTIGKLSSIRIRVHKGDGRLSDGGGLYLQVRGESRTWIFRYANRATKREHEIGLGPLATIDLRRARELAAHNRAVLVAGSDPLAIKRRDRLADQLRAARMMTFEHAAEQYIAAHADGWRNPKHKAQWTATLKTYCKPINRLPVASVDTTLVLQCLQPIWKEKTETATRVRQRIEAVLDWATVRKFREGDNPARWRGHLESLLPELPKSRRVERRVALPYADAAAFMAELRKAQGLGARALELQILTAARPGEVAAARWQEIELAAASWTIPAARMKAGREHRVALSPAAVTLLQKMPRSDDAVFPGPKGKPITTASMLKAARAIRAGIDAHGFRSTFRDWAAERSTMPREVAESALANALQGVEAAYRRSDLFAKRARLMADWARFLDHVDSTATVTAMRKAKA